MSNQFSDWTQHKAMQDREADRLASSQPNRLPKVVTPWDAALAAADVRDLVAKCPCIEGTKLPDLSKLNMIDYAYLRKMTFQLARWFREGCKT